MTELTKSEPISRSISLTNEEWGIVGLALESYSETYRHRQSQIVTTYLTRGQTDLALQEVNTMNNGLQQLDKLQANLYT